MAMTLITPPAAMPVGLEQVKSHLKIEHAADDTLLGELIAQATAFIENRSGRKLITQNWRIYFDSLPGDGLLALPVEPVRALDEVRVFDAEGNATIADATQVRFDGHSSPPRLWIDASLCPELVMNGVEVDVEAGFGDAAIDVPGDLVRAILLTIAHWYEMRGAVDAADQPVSVPAGLDSLLAPYRRVRL